MASLGLVANIYNEANALPGWLETHLPFFDDVRVMHAGPGGAYSNDGTIELLEKWRIPIEFCAIDEGFGVVRTKTIRMSPCDYVLLLDADERFYSFHYAMSCLGEATPHSEVDSILQSYDFRDLKQKPIDWNNISRLGANLKVVYDLGTVFNQIEKIRQMINDPNWKLDAIMTVRRHWHDFTFRRPTQNWRIEPDWQLRLVRNHPSIYYLTETRMHERLVGHQAVWHGDVITGPFFDHFHFHFKKMEMEQRAHDVAIYDSIHKGETPPSFEAYRGGV